MTQFVLIFAACLLVSSGQLDWVAAWVYLGVYAVGTAVTALGLIPTNRDLLAERANVTEGADERDRRLAGLMALIGPTLI